MEPTHSDKGERKGRNKIVEHTEVRSHVCSGSAVMAHSPTVDGVVALLRAAMRAEQSQVEAPL